MIDTALFGIYVLYILCNCVTPLCPSHSTWNHFSSERFHRPTQLCSSHIQALSTPTPATTNHSVGGYNTSALLPVQSSDINWRCDQNNLSRGSSDLKLAKIKDHIQPMSGYYASGRRQSVIGYQNDSIHEDIGLQAKGDRDMIQSKAVAERQICGQKRAATSVVCIPSSSHTSNNKRDKHRGFEIPGRFPYLIRMCLSPLFMASVRTHCM